jgi:peptide deformylase
MAKHEIAHLGHPALRAKSSRVTKQELGSKQFQSFIDELCSICDTNQGVGIAAPQVGINKRVIVVHVDPNNSRYPDKKPFPLTVVVNPKVIEHAKDQVEGWEGDLSATLRAIVPRPKTCVVTGLDRNGKSVKYDLTYDFHARVFQHEIDHLDGIMMIDRVKRRETICELPEWEKFWKDQKTEPTQTFRPTGLG